MADSIAKKIEHYEMITNGFYRLNGYHVLVTNIKQLKDMYVADVIHVNNDAGGKTEYKKCEYPKDLLLKKLL